MTTSPYHIASLLDKVNNELTVRFIAILIHFVREVFPTLCTTEREVLTSLFSDIFSLLYCAVNIY